MKQESRNLAVTLTAGMIAILLIVCAAVSFVGCRQLARSLDRAKTEALSADGSGAAGEAAAEESASASVELSAQAELLQEAVRQFKV